MSKVDEQIVAIEKKLEQQRERLRDLKAQSMKQERKDAIRRKILYGAAYLAATASLSDETRRRSLERIEAYITRSKDREFLGLKPLEAKAGPVCEAETTGRHQIAELPFGQS